MNPSLTDHWNRLPPLFAVVIARKSGRPPKPISLGQIAKRSGLSIQRVEWIYYQDSWDEVSLGQMERFLGACGINQGNFWRHLTYLRRTRKSQCPLAHIDNGLDPKTVARMAARVAKAMEAIKEP